LSLYRTENLYSKSAKASAPGLRAKISSLTNREFCAFQFYSPPSDNTRHSGTSFRHSAPLNWRLAQDNDRAAKTPEKYISCFKHCGSRSTKNATRNKSSATAIAKRAGESSSSDSLGIVHWVFALHRSLRMSRGSPFAFFCRGFEYDKM
jgi:hypothetical protein